MITKIFADNYKCLDHFEFRPRRQLNLLLGDNGSGKTSLFEVLLRLRDLVVGGSSVASLFGFSKTIWDPRGVQTFELEVKEAQGTYLYRLEIEHPPPTAPQKPVIKTEDVTLAGKPLFRYRDGEVHLFRDDHIPDAVFPFKPAQSFLPSLESQNPQLQWFKTFLAGVNVFQLNPFALNPFSQHDERFLLPNGSNFASWLRYLSDEQPKSKTECEKHLEEVIPGFQRFRFRPVGDQKALLADFAREDHGTYELALANLSEGQRILSILYSVLYGLIETASVLCFDEPENFISLPEVQPWLRSLRDMVEEKSGQALVISHHPEVIDYLAADSAFRFERANGGPVKVSPWIADSEPSQPMKPSEILVRGG